MEELIQKLRLLGFTEYESKVFLAVLQGDKMSATEVAEAARIRRTDVYKVLRGFVEKGICNEIETNSILKYEVIDPDVIFDKIENDIRVNRGKEIDAAKITLEKIKPLYKTKKYENNGFVNVELIRGFNQHRESKFIDLFKKAKYEILFMTQPEMLISDEVDKIAMSFYKKGGVIKSIYQSNNQFKLKTKKGWITGSEKDLADTLEKFEILGEKIKITSRNVPNITVFDKSTVFMNVNDKTIPRHNEADIIVRSESFALSMISVFDYLWESSFTIKEFKKNIANKSLKKSKEKLK